MQTPDSNQPAPADYHAGLLRLWREGAGEAWRASLQLAEEGERAGDGSGQADLDVLSVRVGANGDHRC